MFRRPMNSRSFLTHVFKLTAVAAALTVRSASGGHGPAAEAAAAEVRASAESPADGEAGKAIHGVSLGDYRIRSHYQVDAQKSIVRFSLYATVKNEHFGEVQGLVEEHREKLRDQVIMATRLTPLNLFQEPDLATFRRRVLVRLRRAIPELTIEDLYVSEFDLTIKSL
jgi:hypothetical protein